jgi:hypothetical protein
MSSCDKVEIVCPKCLRPQMFEDWLLVNVTLNPEMKSRVMDGDLFNLTCVGCGTKTHIQKPLLYGDTKKGFMVHLLHGEEPEPDDEGVLPKLDNVKLRYVDTEMQFYEKIRILDDGLDDRIIEIEKRSLVALVREEWQNNPLDVLYQGISKYAQGGKQIGYFVVLEEGVKNLTFPFPAKYKQNVRQFTPGLPDSATEMGRWLKVDSEYAKARLVSLDQKKRSRPRASASGITPASRQRRLRPSATGITPASKQRRPRPSATGITPASKQRRARPSAAGITPASKQRQPRPSATGITPASKQRRARPSAAGITAASKQRRARRSAAGITPASKQRQPRPSASGIAPASKQRRRHRFKR